MNRHLQPVNQTQGQLVIVIKSEHLPLQQATLIITIICLKIKSLSLNQLLMFYLTLTMASILNLQHQVNIDGICISSSSLSRSPAHSNDSRLVLECYFTSHSHSHSPSFCQCIHPLFRFLCLLLSFFLASARM